MRKLIYFALLLLFAPLARAGTCTSTVLTAVALLRATAPSQCYYISYSTGNDTNTGADEAHPWKTYPGMTGSGVSHTTLNTDGLIFKGGDTWPNTVFPWNFGGNGGGSSVGVYIGYDPAWNNGTVTQIEVTSSGYNCSAITVTLSGGGGSVQATATGNFLSGVTNLWNGLLQHVTLNTAGSGYTSNPTVSFAGSTCTTLPTAVADIYSPIFDGSGTNWDNTNLYASSRLMSFGGGLTNAIFDHITFQGLTVNPAMLTGAGHVEMVTITNSQVTVNACHFHKFGILNFAQTGANQPNNDVQGLNLNSGYTVNSTVQNSFFDNYAMNIAGPCGWTSNTNPGAGSPYCSQAISSGGATTFTGNILHDARSGDYDGPSQTQVHSGNVIWDMYYDAGSQHGDSIYFHNGGYIFNNIIHDTQGGSNYLFETCSGSNCNTPNVVYAFNNVTWDQGTGTTQGFWNWAAEFTSATSTWSTNPNLYYFNNTSYCSNGGGNCASMGQWFSQNNTFWQAVTISLYNNHAITDQGTSHWYTGSVSSTCTLTNSCGTWNGNVATTNANGPNSSGVQALIDPANTVQGTSAASGQGYVFSNALAPTASGNATVTASGTNLTNSGAFSGWPGCTGILVAACKDINGVNRPATGAWQTGAYEFTGSGTVATPTFAPGAGTYSSSQSVTISTSTGGASLFYCTDLVNTCTPSTPYTTAVTIAVTGTYLRAQGTESGFTSSAIASALYTINSVTSAPAPMFAFTLPARSITVSVPTAPLMDGNVSVPNLTTPARNISVTIPAQSCSCKGPTVANITCICTP